MSEKEIAVLRALLTSRPRPAGVAERRARLDALGNAYPTASDIRLEPTNADGVPAEWSAAPGADSARVLLYLHGGGFSAGSIASHRAMVTETGRAAQARTLAINYRRTPEHPFPAALDDALKAYRWLLAQGVQPSRIAIGGDSAGGGLTLATMVSLRESVLPLPACAWCISPWVDMEARRELWQQGCDRPHDQQAIHPGTGRLVSRRRCAAHAACRSAARRSCRVAAAAHSGRQC